MRPSVVRRISLKKLYFIFYINKWLSKHSLDPEQHLIKDRVIKQDGMRSMEAHFAHLCKNMNFNHFFSIRSNTAASQQDDIAHILNEYNNQSLIFRNEYN